MEYRSLGRTGLRVSQLGFGASPLGAVFGAVDPAECARAVHCAIDLGVNFFDVAPYYGSTLAEERLGGALAGHRHELIVATKCGRYGEAEFDFSGGRVERSIEESLRRLRTDYVDLFQVHDIEFGDERQILEETLPAMRKLQSQGKARFIGITGLQLGMLRRVAEGAGVDTVLSYCRYNLLVTDMDELLRPAIKARGIGLINASPLHMGMLTAEGPPHWHPAPPVVAESARRIARLCEQRGRNVTDVALRFCLAHPYTATTLIGMASEEQVRRNASAAGAAADTALWEEIRAALGLDANLIWQSGRPENNDYANRSAAN